MIEKDPHGTAADQPGAKLDAGKTRAGLAISGFARALLAVSDVATFGAAKYTPNGWVSVPDGIERYTDAMHRHLLAEATGERLDGDSGLAHAAHAAWNALARLELMLREGQQLAATAEQTSAADADGWIAWEGGECPVGQRVRVDYLMRDGTECDGPTEAWALDWSHSEGSSDIIAYRLSKGASHG